ncbi:MAG: ABC transporter permease [Protaetiibacter sp.]
MAERESRRIADRVRGVTSFLTANPQMRLGAPILLVVVLSAVLAPLISPYDPVEPLDVGPLAPPSLEHWFGTDELARDQFSRVLYGGQVSLSVAVLAVSISMVAGGILGVVAGYYRGAADAVIMRVMDAMISFPSLLLALAIGAMLGAGMANTMIAVGIVGIPAFARLMRSQTLTIRDFDFVNAARIAGLRDGRIIARHVLPNGIAPVFVYMATSIAGAILMQATLAFLGLGATPPTPDWGSMLQSGYGYIAVSPMLSVGPGVAIVLSTMGFILVGEALGSALDPKRRRSRPLSTFTGRRTARSAEKTEPKEEHRS